MLVAELNKFMPIMNLENVILNNAFSLTRHTLKKSIIIGWQSGNLLGISSYLAGSEVYIEASDNDAAYDKSVSV